MISQRPARLTPSGTRSLAFVATVLLLTVILPGLGAVSLHTRGLPCMEAESAGAAGVGDARLRLSFIENHGQVDSRVSHYVEGRNASIYFTSEGVTFALIGKPGRDRTDHALKLDFVGANSGVTAAGRDVAPGRVNYLKGPRESWRTNLKTYTTLAYENLWPEIDLIYDGTATRLKYRFVVRPGATPDHIKLAYRGATSVRVNDGGQLDVETPMRRFQDAKPYAYQEVNGQRVEVDSRYDLVDAAAEGRDGHQYRFRIGGYDTSKPLIIDPAILFYSGFLGGSGGASGYGIAVDDRQNAYVTGVTASIDFPLTPGAYMTPGGPGDVFVTKIHSDGEMLLYSTRFGGSADDTAEAIALHGTIAYVTGRTSSDDFPMSVGAFDDTYNGPDSDAFLTTLNEHGTDILYSTYFGGSAVPPNQQGEGATAIAVGKAGQAYITGWTSATDLPTRGLVIPPYVYIDPFQADQPGGDAFVAKFDPALMGNASLVYSTYLGGGADDYGTGIAVAGNGTAWVVGSTSSDDFPIKNGLIPDQIGADAFVTQLSAAGTALVYSTYLGGSDNDAATAVALDAASNAYVTGVTSSVDFPFSNDAFDKTLGSWSDAFVTKLTSAGAIAYSTFLGGSAFYDAGRDIAVDQYGNAYVTGFTASYDFPTKDAIMPYDPLVDPYVDAFVTKLNADGTAVVFSTLLGGSGSDKGFSIAVDGCGHAYVTGETDSAFFPTTVDAWDPSFNPTSPGLTDAFALRVDPPGADLAVVKLDSPDPVQTGSTLTYNVIVTNKGSATAHNVMVYDFLPQPVVLVSVVVGGGGSWIDLGDHISPQIGHVLQINLGTMKCGDKLRVRIRVTTPRAHGQIVNYASAFADEPDPNPSDNTTMAVTQIF